MRSRAAWTSARVIIDLVDGILQGETPVWRGRPRPQPLTLRSEPDRQSQGQSQNQKPRARAPAQNRRLCLHRRAGGHRQLGLLPRAKSAADVYDILKAGPL